MAVYFSVALSVTSDHSTDSPAIHRAGCTMLPGLSSFYSLQINLMVIKSDRTADLPKEQFVITKIVFASGMK